MVSICNGGRIAYNMAVMTSLDAQKVEIITTGIDDQEKGLHRSMKSDDV